VPDPTTDPPRTGRRSHAGAGACSDRSCGPSRTPLAAGAGWLRPAASGEDGGTSSNGAARSPCALASASRSPQSWRQRHHAAPDPAELMLDGTGPLRQRHHARVEAEPHAPERPPPVRRGPGHAAHPRRDNPSRTPCT
jgi:hypothetical protein